MKKLYFTLSLLMYPFLPMMSQWNIYSIVHGHLIDHKENIHGSAKYIEWNMTYYDKNGSGFMIETKSLNKNNQIIHSKMNNNNSRQIDIVYKFDPKTKLLMSQRNITLHPVIGKIVDKHIYKYDQNNFLVEVISMNGNNQITEKAKIQNDEKGYPVELINYDKNDKMLGGIEKAQYLLDKNLYISSIFSNDGQLISQDTFILNFSENCKYPNPEKEYNNNCDIVKSKISSTGYELNLYEYDHFGNWIKNEVFTVSILPDGSEDKKLKRIYNRKIFYRKKLNKR